MKRFRAFGELRLEPLPRPKGESLNEVKDLLNLVSGPPFGRALKLSRDETRFKRRSFLHFVQGFTIGELASGEKTTRPLAVERRIQTKQRTSPRVICFWILLSSFLSNHSQFNPMSGYSPRTRIKKQFSGPDMGLIVWLWLARKLAM